MGELVTFTIYMDGISEILKHPKKFCEKLYESSLRGNIDSFGLGYHASLVKIQQRRHADDATTYVHMGNTVCEMDGLSEETIKIMKENPKFFKEMLSHMKGQIRDLENQFEEANKNSNL